MFRSLYPLWTISIVSLLLGTTSSQLMGPPALHYQSLFFFHAYYGVFGLSIIVQPIEARAVPTRSVKIVM